MGLDERSFRARFRTSLKEALCAPALAGRAEALGADVLSRLEDFAYALVSANQDVNLTAITEPEDVAVKHIADSILTFDIGPWDEGARVCDVGSGGGVPGVVLALVRPDLEVTLLDSVAKKLKAVDGMRLGRAPNVRTLHGRAEEVGQLPSYREGFDVVTARAVARLAVLAELCLPLVRVGGWFVALKGPSVDDEIHEATRALSVLGGRTRTMKRFVLSPSAGERTLIGIEKVARTPNTYPRRPGTPAKNPIGFTRKSL